MKRLMPLGSVVMLTLDEEDLVLIVSRAVKESEEDAKIWDYCGCSFPEGINNPNQYVFFDQKDIVRMIFIGLQNEKELKYSMALADYKRKMEEE